MPITKLRGGLQVKDDSVSSSDIEDRTIIGADIALNSLKGDLFINGTISASKIVDGTITDSQIMDRTITGIKLALDTLTVSEIDCSTIAGEGLIKSPTTGKLDIKHNSTLLISGDTLSVNTSLITTNGNFVDIGNVIGVKNGTNKSFSLDFPPSPALSLHLFWNGVLQIQGVGNDYELSGQSLTLAFAPDSNDELKASYRKI